MELTPGILKSATDNGLITELQAEQLWKFLKERGQDTPSFRFTHILYYLGGLIAIGAMSLFMTLGWERFGGWGLFFIALTYAGADLWLTEFLLNRRRLPIPAGITATFLYGIGNACVRCSHAVAVPAAFPGHAGCGNALVYEHGSDSFPLR